MQFTSHWISPLGGITLASDGTSLTGLRFDGQRPFEQACSGDVRAEADAGTAEGAGGGRKGAEAVFSLTRRWLTLYFQGNEPDFLPPLDPCGTPFQKRIWRILRTIPYGETASYGAIARQAAAEAGTERIAAQAVGSAAARNPILILIPCHRVVGANGSLTGYAGGLDRKEYLLRLEQAGSRCG